MQNCGIFQLHFHSSCRTCCCCSSSCACFASLRFASTCLASLLVRPEFALFAACLFPFVSVLYNFHTFAQLCFQMCNTLPRLLLLFLFYFVVSLCAATALSLRLSLWDSVWEAERAENRTNVGSFFARVANCI